MYNINYSTETITPITRITEIDKKQILINSANLTRYTELICTDKKCRYPQLALRLLNHIIAEVDNNNIWLSSARQISERFNVHYDTVTKCLKYLRSINVIKIPS